MSANAASQLFADLGIDFDAIEKPTASAIKEVTTPNVPVSAPVTNPTVAPVVLPMNNASNVISQLTGKSIQEISALANSGVSKLHQIEIEINNVFVEREQVIKDLIRALTVGHHMLLLGPPGTAKSKLAREICSRIDGGHFFEWLLNRTSDPAEILGPYSIKAMEQDKFLRKVKGKLPEAHIAFIDEIYKSNEPTLNILLPLLNERVFYNDGKAIEVPLISMIAASNEEPDDDSLKALHDRLVFRTYVDYIKEPGNRMKMHQNFVTAMNGSSLNTTNTRITLAELEAIRFMSKKLPVQANVYKVFAKLLGVLDKNGIKVSDRRQNECYRIMQGNATYYNRNMVVLDDLNALKSVLWEQQKDIPFVSNEIDKLVNPFDDEMASLWKKATEVINNINKISNSNDKCGASIEAKQRLEDIMKKMNVVIRDAGNNGKDTTDFVQKRDKIVAESQKLVQEAIGLNLSDLGINLGTNNSPF